MSKPWSVVTYIQNQHFNFINLGLGVWSESVVSGRRGERVGRRLFKWIKVKWRDWTTRIIQWKEDKWFSKPC